MKDMKHLRFWCMKVLPCVYDDALSYYEVLCKTAKYINELIEQDKVFASQIDEVYAVAQRLQEWIDNYDTTYIQNLVEEYLEQSVKDVVFGISEGGYFMALIPPKFSEIEFGTIQDGELYGHLVLAYD